MQQMLAWNYCNATNTGTKLLCNYDNSDAGMKLI